MYIDVDCVSNRRTMGFKLWLETNEIVMPKLFEKVKQLKGEYSGVHFSKSDQLSFNLNPGHFDPIGIYVFPKKYVLEGNLASNTMFASYPYSFLIEPTQQAKILNLDMDFSTAEKLLEKMGIDKTLLYSKEVYHRGGGQTPGHRLWGAMENFRNIPRSFRNLGRNSSWNALFSKTGYNALYDPGLKIIHVNEPAQVIYLDHKAYRVIDIVRNTNKRSMLTQFASYFPDFKMYKKGGMFSTDGEYGLKLKKDTIEISTWTSKNSPNSMGIKVYGFGERYSNREWYVQINSKEDLEKVVEEVKEFMSKSKITPPHTSEADYSFMYDVSKLYNLKIDPEFPGIISKKYRNDTKFKLTYTPSTNKATLIVERMDYGRYFFYHEIEAKEVEETIKELFDGLKENIKERKSGTSLIALQFVEFLENRVFIKRNNLVTS